METVGFIGLGNIGGIIAERLRSAGFSLVVHDVREDVRRVWKDKGATLAESAADVASQVNVVFLSLPTPDVVESVALRRGGLIEGAKVTHIVDLSTTGPDVTRRLAGALAEQRISWIDCPVAGGLAGARAGTLSLIVGAPALALERVADMLRAFGKVFHVGNEPGAGQVLKLINNLMSAAALTFSAEAIALAAKSGLDPETVVTVLNASSGRNSATQDKFPRQILTRFFDAGFAMGLMLKDLELCLGQAESLGFKMPASEMVRDLWRSGVQEIGAGEDFTRIVLMAEKQAGIVFQANG